MRHRRVPREVGGAVQRLLADVEPVSLLAAVQRAWPEAVGAAIAAQATPTAAASGVVTVTCASAVWAQELELRQGEVLAALNSMLRPPGVSGLRPRAAPSGRWARSRG